MKKRFGEKPDGIFPGVHRRGWIEETGRIVRLTEEGMAYSDYIGQAFDFTCREETDVRICISLIRIE